MNPKDQPGAPAETKEEAAQRQEAENFFNDIMLEVKNHDMQNAMAMAQYWEKAKLWTWGKKEEPVLSVPQTPAKNLNDNGYVEKTLREGVVLERSTAAGAAAATKPSGPMINSWLFKKVNPDYVPLMSRWWVPWVAVATIGLIWTPDPWKLRTLYMVDHQYALARQAVHKWYWRMTMDPADYEVLLKQMEANVPKRKQVKSSDCPF